VRALGQGVPVADGAPEVSLEAPRAGLQARRYLNSALLLIDEVGSRLLDRHEANLSFRPISTRYEKGFIILPYKKHVADWPEIFAEGEVLIATILDRLLHHVHILPIHGGSCRLQ
jgi:DNA replication protein DnaC